MRDLINHKKNEATVKVTLKNEGTDAWMPNKCGRSITICRTIKRSGVSSYKVLSHDGKTVSTEKRFVKDMLAHFGIQTSNPCVILNQENAKEFLSGSSKNSSGSKYKFFLKATTLDSMHDRVAEAKQNQEDALQCIKNAQSRMPELKKKVKELEHTFSMSKGMDDLKAQLVSLKGQKVWAKVQEVELEVEEQKAQIERAAKKGEEYEATISALEAKNSDAASQRQALEAELENADQKAGLAQKAHSECRKRLKDCKKRVAESTSKLRALEEKRKRAEKRRDQQQATIQHVRAENSRDYETLEQERQKKLEGLRSDLQKLRTVHDREECDLTSCQRSMEDADRSVRELDKQLQSMKQNERELDRDIKQAELQQRDSQARFGEHTASIVKDIEALQNRFSVLPRGPIGRYIKLAGPEEEEWLEAIEPVLGQRVLCGYLVNSKEDVSVLARIFKKYQFQRGMVPSIIVQPFRSEKYADLQPVRHGRARNIFSCLQIEDPWVSNVVVDQTNCEKWLMMEDSERDQAYRAAQTNREVKGIRLRSGDQITCRGGAMVYDRNKNQRRRQLLAVDLTQHVNRMRQELAECSNSIKLVMQNHRKASAEKNEKKRELAKHQANLQKLNRQVQQIDRQILETEREGQDEGEDIQVYEDELKTFINELKEVLCSHPKSSNCCWPSDRKGFQQLTCFPVLSCFPFLALSIDCFRKSFSLSRSDTHGRTHYRSALFLRLSCFTARSYDFRSRLTLRISARKWKS